MLFIKINKHFTDFYKIKTVTIFQQKIITKEIVSPTVMVDGVNSAAARYSFRRKPHECNLRANQAEQKKIPFKK